MSTNIINQNQGVVSKIESFLGEIFCPEPKGHKKDSSYGLGEPNFLDSLSPYFKNPFANFSLKEASWGLAGLGLISAFLLRNTLPGRFVGLASLALLAACGRDKENSDADTGLLGTDLSEADASFIGESTYNEAGSAVAGIGDMNKDGYDDLAIGAPGIDGGGAVYIVNGFPSDEVTNLSSADAKLTGEDDMDAAGSSVAGAGDIDKDGYDDLLIGAPSANGGVCYVVYAPINSMSLSEADAKLTGEDRTDHVGSSVANVGDMNDDGIVDIIIGASSFDDDSAGGAAYLIYGPPSSISLENADVQFFGQENDNAGSSVAGAGDVNGDGRADLIIGAKGESYEETGGAYLIYASASSVSLEDADVRIDGENVHDVAGISVSGPGDMNKDGYDDILIGAPGSVPDADGNNDVPGTTYLLYGPLDESESLSYADVKLTGEEDYDCAGYSVAGAGDVDKDGNVDLLIGAFGYSTYSINNRGAAYVVYGPVKNGTISLSGADAKWVGEEVSNDEAGSAVANGGDVNQDGYSDFLIGAPGSGTYSTGAAYLILGGS